VSCAASPNASRKSFAGGVALLPIPLEELTDRDLLFFYFFWNFSGSRKAIGIADFAIDFGFTRLKAARVKVKQLDQHYRKRLIVECETS
jgi:hypothetical protein